MARVHELQKDTIAVTTDGSGNATAYFDAITGELDSIKYTKPGGSADYDSGVDFTITTETGGEGLWTESSVDATKKVRPRVITNNQTGGALAVAANIPNTEMVRLVGDRIKVGIAQGGDTHVGMFTAIWKGAP